MNTIYAKNVMVQIFRDHWSQFKQFHPTLIDDNIETNVQKMMGCGLKENGYIEYWCATPGCHYKRIIPFSCKSRFCLRCGRVYVEKWLLRMKQTIFNKVIHRHVILTVPDTIWPYIHKDRVLLDVLTTQAKELLQDMVANFKPARPLKIGIISVIQTFGRKGTFNPHVHLLVTEGGIAKNGRWYNVTYIDKDLLRKKWLYYLLKGLKEALKEDPDALKIIEDIYQRRKDKGLITRAMADKIRRRDIVSYLISYVASPPITLSRIIDYDGTYVTYIYKEHPTNEKVTIKVTAYQFIAWMIQHIAPKGLQMVRYFGLYGRKVITKTKAIIENLLKETGVTFKRPEPINKTYRERMIESFKIDPFICPHCGSKMELMYIWHPEYGYLYDFTRDSEEIIPDVLEKKENTTPQYSNDTNLPILQEAVRNTN